MSDNANVLVQMLESMTGTKWIIVGVLLLILEVVTGTTYILWPAVAALVVGLIAFVLPLGWEMQFLLFSILSTVLLVCLLYTSPSPRDRTRSRMPSSA